MEKLLSRGRCQSCQGRAQAYENRRLFRHLFEHNKQYNQICVDSRFDPIGDLLLDAHRQEHPRVFALRS